MKKRNINITVAMLLIFLASCSMSRDEQAVGVGFYFSHVDERIEDEGFVNIPEQATSSDTADNSDIEDEDIVNVEVDFDTESEIEANIENTDINIEKDTEHVDISHPQPEINGSELAEEDLSEIENQMEEDNHSMNMLITIGDRSFDCTLYENETTYAFIDQLPLTITMSELNGNEKYYYLENSLPSNSSRPNKIHTGELMLFGTDCLVLFYEDFNSSYSYTSIGYVNDPDQLADVLGRGSVQVVFEMK